MAGQSAPEAPNRVIHVWVDPVYGDDQSGGAALNPNNANSICAGTPDRPHDVVDPAQGSPLLLHASWPFKTITA